VWLAGGTPHVSTFPFTSASFTLQEGGKQLTLTPEELGDAQQYCMADTGYPQLVQYLEEHVAAVHGPQQRPQIAVTCGNTSALDCVLRCICNRGDVILVEEWTYAPALQLMHALGLRIKRVPCDACGPCLESMVHALEEREQPRVVAMYCVPVSANPTGVTWSQERKKAVCALAQKHNVVLIEDDAYFYLQFNTAAPGEATQQPGLTGLGKSLLSYDTSGHVVRLDTVSKGIAPGLRLGWITTSHSDMHTALVRTFQGSVQGAASLSQVLLNRLLRDWHPQDGFHTHLQRLQASYAARCVALCAAAERHLGTGGKPWATWLMPSAGMFLWLHLHCKSSHASGVLDTETELQALLGDYAVAAVPGARFSSEAGVRSPHLRVSFASASEPEFEAGMQRLAALLEHVDSRTASA